MSIRKINIGIVGYGVVGNGVIQLLQKRKNYIQNKFRTEFVIKTVCDRSIQKKETGSLGGITLTTRIQDVIDDPEIEVVVELMGGLNPAKELVIGALSKGKHIVTANKALIADSGKELFELARSKNCQIYFESSVGAGIPVIKSISEGIAGNKCKSVYGIINGTCNFILTEMTKNKISFAQALEDAQKKGYAESNPTLDINGMDSTNKLAILVYLAFNKFIKVDEIYTEGITQISHDDIEYAESLNLRIKLLAIAKKVDREIEARVHPTLISKDHPLASINGINNAIYLDTDAMGDLLISGEGAGQMAAASGVVSDLINYSSRAPGSNLFCNIFSEAANVKVRTIDDAKTKFYLRFMAADKPGVLGKITGILGDKGIGINSVQQRQHNPAASVPVIMLTDYTLEKNLRQALEEIQQLPLIKGKPVAIRMEKL
jgi:homoserine dehydrogenase